MKIIMIGAGRVATHLGKAFLEAGHDIVQVFSRTPQSASDLARKLNARATTVVEEVLPEADLYVFSVSDAALPTLAERICSRCKGTFVHTAGSMPLDLFPPSAVHHGVLYPMQTFTKTREVDFSEIPCFIEASDQETLSLLQSLSGSISRHVYRLSSEDRRFLHLAAVFACNFANHCYAIASDVLARCGLPFNIMLPLIRETAEKAGRMEPREAQTGPAVRYDENVMQAQKSLLDNNPMWKQIYELMSQDIHNMANDND